MEEVSGSYDMVLILLKYDKLLGNLDSYFKNILKKKNDIETWCKDDINYMEIALGNLKNSKTPNNFRLLKEEMMIRLEKREKQFKILENPLASLEEVKSVLEKILKMTEDELGIPKQRESPDNIIEEKKDNTMYLHKPKDEDIIEEREDEEDENAPLIS